MPYNELDWLDFLTGNSGVPMSGPPPDLLGGSEGPAENTGAGGMNLFSTIQGLLTPKRQRVEINSGPYTYIGPSREATIAPEDIERAKALQDILNSQEMMQQRRDMLAAGVYPGGSGSMLAAGVYPGGSGSMLAAGVYPGGYGSGRSRSRGGATGGAMIPSIPPSPSGGGLISFNGQTIGIGSPQAQIDAATAELSRPGYSGQPALGGGGIFADAIAKDVVPPGVDRAAAMEDQRARYTAALQQAQQQKQAQDMAIIAAQRQAVADQIAIEQAKHPASSNGPTQYQLENMRNSMIQGRNKMDMQLADPMTSPAQREALLNQRASLNSQIEGLDGRINQMVRGGGMLGGGQIEPGQSIFFTPENQAPVAPGAGGPSPLIQQVLRGSSAQAGPPRDLRSEILARNPGLANFIESPEYLQGATAPSPTIPRGMKETRFEGLLRWLEGLDEETRQKMKLPVGTVVNWLNSPPGA